MNHATLQISDAQNTLPCIIRPLTADDALEYRTLRVRIQQTKDNKFLTDTLVEEKFTTEDDWRRWCTQSKEHCIMGTFVDGELVGIMGITVYGAAADLIAEWSSTWLDPRYRKSGAARASYEKVQQWTKQNGYKKAAVVIRDDNTHSRTIREKQGAIFCAVKNDERWDDGSICKANIFMIDLYPVDQKLAAIHYLESIPEGQHIQDPLPRLKFG